MSDHWWSKYANFLPTLFQSAADEIFNRTDILDGYELKFVYGDTKGKEGLAGKVLNEVLSASPPKIAVFGPQMSDEVKLAGAITPFYNTIQMNFVAKTSTTKDKSVYSTLYSTNYIEDDLNPLRIALMNHFGWNRVATLAYNDDSFTSQIDEFHQALIDNNMTLITSGIITDLRNVENHITRLKQYDSRVIVGAFRSSAATTIFCEVYKQKLYGRRYTWILTGASMYRNWIKNADVKDITCTKANLYEAADYMITLDQNQLSSETKVTISGRTPAEYDSWMKSEASNTPYSITRSHPWIYDAVWALALGLNNSLKYLNGSKLEDFNYDRSDIRECIIKGMDEVSFDGVSGPVSFKDGRRIGQSFIQLNKEDNRTDAGRFDPYTGSITWDVTPSSLWPGNKIPKDGSKTQTELLASSIAAVIILGILTTFGLFGAIGLLIFNIVYRKNRHIKMSSPKINNIIICGGIIMFVSVYVSMMEYLNLVENGALCMLSSWFLAVGFTSAFGALFSKTWRVHVLFHNNSIRKKVIKDIQLFAVCGVLMAIDLSIMVPWTLFFSLQRKEVVVTIEDEENDITHKEIYTVCTSSTQVYWLCVQYVYKGLLLAFGTFLAWETRRVEVPALNDSKLIGFCVYNIVVVCLIGVPLNHILDDEQKTARFVLMNCFVMFCTALVLCILFIPKLKLRNETDNIKFVPSLNGKITSTVRPSQQTKAPSSGSNPDVKYRASEQTKNGHKSVAEASSALTGQALSPNPTTDTIIQSFVAEDSTTVC
ncbi:gamma-aminobutyric acid type B receptor subunit 2-like [Mytilus galloprovincialis]|uniref:gamma-aminobutyric acid type B receptor subunit 2-like n=1 Tax=Mytilus galloprovincialis TaxID=29158 RepID=UPI003F7C4882